MITELLRFRSGSFWKIIESGENKDEDKTKCATIQRSDI